MEKDKVTRAEMKDVKFIAVVSNGSTDVSVSENGSQSRRVAVATKDSES